jgi:hypothetical protein
MNWNKVEVPIVQPHVVHPQLTSMPSPANIDNQLISTFDVLFFHGIEHHSYSKALKSCNCCAQS